MMLRHWGVPVIIILVFGLFSAAVAEDAWRAEFDVLCGKTDESMTMKDEELQDLVVRCDKLLPLIEQSDHPQKKLFIKRLEKCRNLFMYVREVRSKEKK